MDPHTHLGSLLYVLDEDGVLLSELCMHFSHLSASHRKVINFSLEFSMHFDEMIYTFPIQPVFQ